VQVTYVPGLYKIFDEILVNAADNKQRCGGMDSLKVRASSLQRFLALSQSIWAHHFGELAFFFGTKLTDLYCRPIASS